MEGLIVRVMKSSDFYVPFDGLTTVQDVKDEMETQIEVSTLRMKLIFNGKILSDEENLKALGFKNGSIIHLYIPNYDNIFLQDTKREFNEILSLFENINCIPDAMFNDAINEIKTLIQSPKIRALVKIIPDLEQFFNAILQCINQIEAPYDDALINEVSIIEDRYLNIDEWIYEDKSETLTTLCLPANYLDEGLEIKDNDNSIVEDDIPLNINYAKSISTEPLPFVFDSTAFYM
ncbi:Ubiquitin family protein [Trichomonas vaginalis G3]|uniref:Ubiquitin family protein n=1 Tax=Trichomonas vaginalis (strain ATCC PRA-98 / G3) TaxID=412133 RepID=A2EZP4_TRIV3|nr:ubiquitin-like family [Trichomonas vaginalis G3]EAY01882.1 Ubiquitin family protein [Trichomonas vaginalis G3]KAI5549681.1 ubiquitin-like family [Trichomonas vaginalis G3]|eukprot:XP_001314426.1 Ubiquitin family protein [Trichomonas vaginalis G3]